MNKHYKFNLKDQVYWSYTNRTYRITERKFDSLLNEPVYGIRGKDHKVIRYVSERQLSLVGDNTQQQNSKIPQAK